VFGELGDVAEIPVNRVGRVVPDLHVFEHAFAQGGHGAVDLHEATPCVYREDQLDAALLRRHAQGSHCDLGSMGWRERHSVQMKKSVERGFYQRVGERFSSNENMEHVRYFLDYCPEAV
jgi:hypothetical protein